jgi:hypothetical protein
MRRLLFAILLLAVLGAGARAQCVDLGTPALTGCGAGAYAPALYCIGSPPSVGNPNFGLIGGIGAFGGPGILVLGPCPTPTPIAGPFGTNAFCAPAPLGCTAFVDPAVSALLVGLPGGASNYYPLPIPNDPSLVGLTLCAQQIYLALLAVGFCIEVTNGVEITVIP